jgi:hypothetical protein
MTLAPNRKFLPPSVPTEPPGPVKATEPRKLVALHGTISISRTSSNYDNPRPIKITITDTTSGVEAIEASLSLEDFAMALTGMGHITCLFDFNGSGIVGKTREFERRDIFVPHDNTYRDRDEKIRKLLESHETDGWRARDSDASNSHKCVHPNIKRDGVKGLIQSVLFERWVETPREETKHVD